MSDEEKSSRGTDTIRNILSRNFILGFLAFFIFAAANQALTPTIPIYLSQLGSSEREIGVLVGIFGVSSLISRFFVGRWLLRHSKKSAMMIGAALFALGSLAFIFLRPFWPFFAMRFLQGIAFASLDTAALAFVFNVVPIAYRGQGLAYFMLAPNLALAVAPVFAMFLINRYSFTLFFLTCAVLSIGAFIFSYPLDEKTTAKTEKMEQVTDSSFIDCRVITPALVGFLHTFVYGAVVAFFPLYALQNGIKNPGFFFTAVAIMIIAGRSLGGRLLDAWDKDKVIIAFLLVAIIALFTLFFSKSYFMFIIVGILWGTGVSFLAPATMTYAFEYAGSSSGTTVGTFRALTDSGVALGPMIMGVIIPVTGYRGMFLCLTFILLFNLGYFLFYVRRSGACSV